MKAPLHILHLEDTPNDAMLVQATLEREGIAHKITCVQNRDKFVAALEYGGYDLILSDYSLPTYDGLSALKFVKAKWPAIPFIIVSGTLGEELAIESLKSGAMDYVLKERLARLGPAVRRAMQEVEQRAENRRAYEALVETEQRLQTIFDGSPLGIALVGKDGRPVLTNAAVHKMLGYSGQELSRMHFTEFTHPDDRVRTHELYQNFIQGACNGYQVEKRYLHKNGQTVWVRASVSLAHTLLGDSGFSIAMVEDVSERRNLEAQYIEAQKMEVVGHLAGGVAHDFNNILAIIMGYCDLVTQKLGPAEAVRGYIDTIRSAAQRAAGLTRQLLIFSRKQTVQPTVLDLNEVVKDMDKMLRRLLDENIVLTISLNENLGRIKADSGYVGQVLMNLVVNARDAMPAGGQLVVSTGNATFDEAYARAHMGAVAGEFVVLTVKDSGTGMTEEVKARLFEAFFTTKPKGKGTGLGLATCHTIVQQCGGHIDVWSEPGQGTIFKICFPRVDQPLDVLAKAARGEPLPRGTETLLVVEDEPTVRHLARTVLENQGYRVLMASNGQDALNTVRDHEGTPISLVVSDVVMPQMGGKVMAEWLKTANPGLKILFTSGYTDDSITCQGVLEKGVEFLPKPYTPASLALKVREMLDASGT